MTIRRQYSLPNCTLILDGLSNDTETTKDGRPLINILVNAECHFVGSNQILSGGRVFFENLVKATSAYAQEFLSGFAHPYEAQSERVSLERTEKNAHRLIWQPDAEQEKRAEIELTTVQLFDLVEAIDQFFADSQTLPEFALSIEPVSQRHRQAEEPLVQRAAPAAIGTASLAFAAIAFFFVPVPEVREPEPQLQSPNQTVPQTPAEPPGASPAPSGEAPVSPPNP